MPSYVYVGEKRENPFTESAIAFKDKLIWAHFENDTADALNLLPHTPVSKMACVTYHRYESAQISNTFQEQKDIRLMYTSLRIITILFLFRSYTCLLHLYLTSSFFVCNVQYGYQHDSRLNAMPICGNLSLFQYINSAVTVSGQNK